VSSVIHLEDDTAQTVMEYQPKKFHIPVSREAESFVSVQPQQTQTNNFRLSDLVAQQTGIQELEKASVEKRIEEKALERLQEIQERAYKEAYELGMDEGIKRGYEEAKSIAVERLNDLNNLIQKFHQIKPEILQRNEAQLVDMVFALASKLAKVEISKDENRIVPILKQAVESLQKDESMTIKVSPQDFHQIEELKKLTTQEYEFLVAAKLEANEGITPGGCIIETNYGLIDATIEERLGKLSKVLDEAKPQSKKDKFE
jgi:flagellar assembly protein FliH